MILNLYISVALLRVKIDTFDNIETTSFIVNWTPPSGKENYINEYKIEWDAGNVMYISGTDRSATLSTGIVPGTAYTVRIISINTQTEAGANRTTFVSQTQAASELSCLFICTIVYFLNRLYHYYLLGIGICL